MSKNDSEYDNRDTVPNRNATLSPPHFYDMRLHEEYKQFYMTGESALRILHLQST